MQEVTKVNSKTVTLSDIQTAKQGLISLPVKPDAKLSLKDAVQNMYEEIVNLIEKKYTLEDISIKLKDHNINIKPSTLRAYIYSIKNEQKVIEKTTV